MMYLQIAAAIAALVLAAGPSLSVLWTKALEWAWAPSPDAPALLPIAPNYQTSMQHLASVRLRLMRTGCLSDDAAEAVETLTLALMNGSDK